MADPSIATWKKISERGSDILRTAAAQRDGSFSYAQNLLDIVNDLEVHLDEMYTLFERFLQDNGIALRFGEESCENQTADLGEYATLFKKCVHMFDQDFVMKQTIQMVLAASTRSVYPQHLVGFSSVWTCEPYIDYNVVDNFLSRAI